MNDLRKAAEMALEALRNAEVVHMEQLNAMYALQEALAHEALDRMVAENQRLGLYDDNLQTAIEKGTKAWADVPNPGEWVDELRGNTPDCKTHPDAPHGFDRNASHSADRYVCECEGWEPVDWEAVAADQAMTIAMMKIENKKEWIGLTNAQIYEHRWWDEETAFAVNKELMEKNSAPYAKNDTSDRVLHKEWVGLTRRELDIATLGLEDLGDCYLAIEAKLKEKNNG